MPRTAAAILPTISSDRRGIRRLARGACPAGVAWIRDTTHPEAARTPELPFIFAADRLRRPLDPFAAQRPRAGAQRAVRELDLLVAALLERDPQISPADVRAAAVSYARWVTAAVPTTHARLRGLALASWWSSWSAA